VSVDKKDATDSAWAVSGTITVNNPNPMEATVTSVTDSISGFGAIAVSCPVTFPYVLGAGLSLQCSYSSPLPNGTARTNTATASTSGAVAGDSGTAAVTFGAPTTIAYGSVNVTDSNGMPLGSVSGDSSWTYEETFTCDEDEGTHRNTATITETRENASDEVTVNCYALEVTKDATTSFTRTWDWEIDKTAGTDEVYLVPGDTEDVEYTVTVTATPEDSAWSVEGDIGVHNPAPIAARINSLTDVMTGDLAAVVDCGAGVTFPYTLAAGDTLDCTYDRSLPNTQDRTNTATAELQNYSYSPTGVATADGTTDFSGTADVEFDDPTSVIDEGICVTDDLYGDLDPECITVDDLDENNQYSWTYSMTVGPYEDCEEHVIINTATLTTNDTATTDDDDATVTVYPICGCTLTQGYWKTHGYNDGSKFDPTWDLLDDGTHSPEDLEAILETPTGGDPWLILAHQYIAATLNVLAGAGMPAAVKEDYDTATLLIHSYSPGAVPADVASDFIDAAGVLDSYNNGLTGIPHCG
jgi:hypothetical protein